MSTTNSRRDVLSNTEKLALEFEKTTASSKILTRKFSDFIPDSVKLKRRAIKEKDNNKSKTSVYNAMSALFRKHTTDQQKTIGFRGQNLN